MQVFKFCFSFVLTGYFYVLTGKILANFFFFYSVCYEIYFSCMITPSALLYITKKKRKKRK